MMLLSRMDCFQRIVGCMLHKSTARFAVAVLLLLGLMLLTSCSWLFREESVLNDCYVSLEGSGEHNGSSAKNAYAWDNGDGLRVCLERLADGGVAHLAYSDNYTLDGTIVVESRGGSPKAVAIEGSGEPARGGDYGRSVPLSSDAWPKITGTRSVSQFNEGGNTFIRIEGGISRFSLCRLRLDKFNTVLSVGSRNREYDAVQGNIEDIDVDYAREVISIYGPDHNAKFSGWNVKRINAQGVSKRLIRAEGLSNSTLEDIYADTVSQSGIHYKNDWAFLIHFDGPSHDNVIRRFIGKNPMQERKKYANGDCFTCERDTSNFTLQNVMCFHPLDAGFDMKGANHTVQNAAVFNYGNRAFRIWKGPVYLDNVIAAFSGLGEEVSQAAGSNAGIWSGGEAHVSHYTSLNNDTPCMIDYGGSIYMKDSLYMLTQGFLHESLNPTFESDGKYEESNVIRREEERETDTHFPQDTDPQIMHGFRVTFDIVKKQGVGFQGFDYTGE